MVGTGDGDKSMGLPIPSVGCHIIVVIVIDCTGHRRVFKSTPDPEFLSRELTASVPFNDLPKGNGTGNVRVICLHWVLKYQFQRRL